MSPMGKSLCCVSSHAPFCRLSGTSPGSAAEQAIDSMQYVNGDVAPMGDLYIYIYDTTATGEDMNEIDANLIQFSPSPESRSPHDIPTPRETVLRVFPDSGATICLRGPQHLKAVLFSHNNLIPSRKVVRTWQLHSFVPGLDSSEVCCGREIYQTGP